MNINSLGLKPSSCFFLIMDNILFWNARGAGGDDFKSAIKDYVKMNSVDFLIICEPKVQFSKAKDHLLKIRFTDFEIVEAMGFFGGLWLLWNKLKYQIEVMDSNSQSITVKISWKGVQPWLLTGLYARPCARVRQELWNYLASIPANLQLPWVVLGDFNELTNYADKNGGSYTGRFGGLRKWVHNAAMIDLGYQSADFTWSNGRVKERLDRGFCNSDWRLLFPEAKVIHLPKLKSDHCPFLVKV